MNLAILLVFFLTVFSYRAAAQTYCFPGFQMACFYGDQITRVVFAGINHFDNVCNNDADGKRDFTTSVAPAQVISGSTYTLTATFSVNSSVGAMAWLDFNDDGIFQTTEAFNLGTRTSSGDLSVNIPIPATASVSSTRLRIMNRKNNVNAAPGAGDACHSMSSYRGQMKDYTVNIGAGSALPVELKTFLIHDQKEKVSLQWITETERDNDFFTIQRSSDGMSWTTVADVKSAGNSAEEQFYVLEDFSPVYGISYYQILQQDKNGEVRLLDRKSISRQFDETTVFPNPCGNVVTITNLEKQTEVVVYDLFGEEQQHIMVTDKRLELRLDLSDLKSGLYVVVLKNESGTSTLKIHKE